MTLVKELKRLKKREGLTYREIAEEVGVSIDSVFRWFRGENKPSSLARDRIRKYLKEREAEK